MTSLSVAPVTVVPVPNNLGRHLAHTVQVRNPSDRYYTLFKVFFDQQDRYNMKPKAGVLAPGESLTFELLVRSSTLSGPLEEIQDRCQIRTIQREGLTPEEQTELRNTIADVWKKVTKGEYERVEFRVLYAQATAVNASAEARSTAQGTVTESATQEMLSEVSTNSLGASNATRGAPLPAAAGRVSPAVSPQVAEQAVEQLRTALASKDSALEKLKEERRKLEEKAPSPLLLEQFKALRKCWPIRLQC